MVNADAREAMGADLLAAMKALGEGAWMDLTEEDGYRSVWVESYSTMDLRDLADELIRLGWTNSQCRHEAWELDGNRRTCADCGARLPDDPTRKPRRINPTFIT